MIWLRVEKWLAVAQTSGPSVLMKCGEFDYPKSRCGACACACHPTGQGPGRVRPSAGVSLSSTLAVSRQCLLNPHGRLRNCPRWNASRYLVRPSSGWIRRIRVYRMILLCAILSAAHFPQFFSPPTSVITCRGKP